MPRTFIRPYNTGSKAVKMLKEKLKIRSLKIDGTSKYNPRVEDLIINYGNTDDFEVGPAYMLNNPRSVRRAVDKKLFHLVASDHHIPVPEFCILDHIGMDTEDNFEKIWEVFGKDSPIIARTMTRASQGRGTYYFDSIEELPEDLEIDGRSIQMITRYIKKYREFRVHVMERQVFDCVEKKRKKGVENVDYKIRNHRNGWVFCRNNLDAVPQDVKDVAVNAVMALKLHFGAVDVIYNDYKNQAFVLEINTAPGLEETTLEKYAEQFKKCYF